VSGNQVRVGFGITGASKASSDLDQLKDKFTKLQKTLTTATPKSFLTGLGAGAGIAAFNAVGAAVHDVTGFLQDSVHAYEDAEVAQTRLTTSLNANAPLWRDNAKAIDAASTAAINLGFSDEDAKNSLATLVAATHDAGEALKILAVAEDLARFKGISLTDAASALTSIEAGRSRGLAQLGINVKDYATTEERLAAVEKVAGGQARAYAQTDLGQVAVAYAKVSEAQEKFGQGLSKLEVQVLPTAADALSSLADGIYGVTHLTEKLTDAQVREQNIQTLGKTLGPAWVAQAEAHAQAMDDQAASANHASDELIGVRTQTIDFSAAERDAMRVAGAFSGSVLDLSRDFGDLGGSIGSATSALTDSLFGGKINRGKEADLHSQIADIKKQLIGTKGDKRLGLEGQLAAARAALIDLQLQEAEDAGPKALEAFIDKLRSKFGTLDQKTRDYIDSLDALAKKELILQQITNPSGGIVFTGTNPGGTHRAPGTPAPTGIPPRTSTVTKPGRVDVYVHVDGQLSSSQVYTLVQRLGPYLTKYLQTHNVVPHQAVL
jgi:hypothetical protein